MRVRGIGQTVSKLAPYLGFSTRLGVMSSDMVRPSNSRSMK